jgi:hypothetical protein
VVFRAVRRQNTDICPDTSVVWFGVYDHWIGHWLPGLAVPADCSWRDPALGCFRNEPLKKLSQVYAFFHSPEWWIGRGVPGSPPPVVGVERAAGPRMTDSSMIRLAVRGCAYCALFCAHTR